MRLLAALVAFVATLPAQNWCSPSEPVQEALDRMRALNDSGLTYRARIPEQQKIYDHLLAEHGGDPHVHLRLQQFLRYNVDRPRQEIADRYRKLLDEHTDDPVYLHLYGNALLGLRSEEGAKYLEAALKKNPAYAPAHLALAELHGGGRFKDTAKAKEHIVAYFRACPETIQDRPHSSLMRLGLTEEMQNRAATLRKLVASSSDPRTLAGYEPLWELEFRLQAPNKHAELRKQVLADVKSIRERAPKLDVALLRLVRQGHKLAGDSAGEAAATKEILAIAPKSSEAARAAASAWDAENPRPGPDAAEAVKQAYYAKRYAAAREWLKQWPDESFLHLDVFQSASMAGNVPDGEFEQVAERTLAQLRKNQDIWGIPPFAVRVGKEYLTRGIALDRIPSLAEEGFEEHKNRETGERNQDDRDPPEDRARQAKTLAGVEFESVDLMAQAYIRLGQRERASQLRARLPQIEDREPWFQALRLRVRGRVDELEGKKLAAMTFYEKALEVAPRKDKELEKEVQRLWKELGGTDEAWALRKQSKPAEAAQFSAWKAPEKPIPPFNLMDLEGKNRTTDHFSGKTVLINVWATWCGPCIAEHPHFQKLYERLKDRKDVAVISINVDDEVGMVQPYMEKKKYTFPVLLGESFVRSVLDTISIPRNWLLDKKGVHAYEQIGFGEAEGWEDGMLRMIERAGTEPRP